MEAETFIEKVDVTELDSFQPTVPVLPYEILFKIFDFFSTSNRRNFRLVCKHWLAVCNDPRFLRKEQIFFNASYRFSAIVKIIANSDREFVNLKLQSYIIDAEANCLWETLGSKINSLKLSLCHFNETILGHIIFSCPNMTEFSVQGGSYYSGPLPSSDTFLLSKLRHPEERTIRREKLEKLEFEAHSMPVTSADLNRIFSFFPNLKSLAITLCPEGRRKKTKDYTHFQNLLELLSEKTSKIDTLRVNIESGDSSPVLRLGCMDEHDLSKLKDVGMRFDAQSALNDDGLDTIVRYKFWTSLHITSHEISEEKFNIFLIQLLEECPSLTFFETYWQFSTYEPFFAVFPALVKSQIKNLALDIDNETFDERPSFEDIAKTRFKNLRKNRTVSHLTLTFTDDFDFSSIFIEHFPEVRHLKLSHGALEEVFTALPNLLTIQLSADIDYYKRNSSSSKFPKNSITGLLCMDICIFSFKRLKRLSQIKFPDLKSLTLTLSSEELFRMEDSGELDEYMGSEESEFPFEMDDDISYFSEEMDSILSKIAPITPNLRVLSFDFGSFDDLCLNSKTDDCSRDLLRVFFKSCQKWRQLRYLETKLDCSEIGSGFCKRHIIKCYKKNPSLRAIHCVTEEEKLASFFNVLKNKVKFNKAVSRTINSSYRLEIGIDPMNCWKLHD